MLTYIRSTPALQDIVVSGGDSYLLSPEQLRYIGDELLSIPHIHRFRIASKGLCFSPSRTLDTEDTWTDELIRLSDRGKERGKQVALHTHFNHVNEISWVTREATQRLFEAGVIVRNQSVLLRGVNDDVETMGALIRELADMNVLPVGPPSLFLLLILPSSLSFSSTPFRHHPILITHLPYSHSTTSTNAT
jgi:lysine 2,3-aminomutase